MFPIGARNFSNVGFVGLGHMGNFMAKNLIKKGYKLTVYDINKAAIDKVVAAGGKAAGNLSEVSKNSEVIVTMLPMNQHVLEAYTGKDGIIKSADRPKIRKKFFNRKKGKFFEEACFRGKYFKFKI